MIIVIVHLIRKQSVISLFSSFSPNFSTFKSHTIFSTNRHFHLSHIPFSFVSLVSLPLLCLPDVFFPLSLSVTSFPYSTACSNLFSIPFFFLTVIVLHMRLLSFIPFLYNVSLSKCTFIPFFSCLFPLFPCMHHFSPCVISAYILLLFHCICHLFPLSLYLLTLLSIIARNKTTQLIYLQHLQ